MDTLKIERESSWGEKDSKPKEWQLHAAALIYPLSMAITILGSMLMKLGNILMFDTHHLSITIEPKE